MDAKLLDGSESEDVEKVLPIAVWQLSALRLDRADRSNELGEVGNRRARVMLIKPAESPRCVHG
jgi:hypothetical protein